MLKKVLQSLSNHGNANFQQNPEMCLFSGLLGTLWFKTEHNSCFPIYFWEGYELPIYVLILCDTETKIHFNLFFSVLIMLMVTCRP